MDMVRHGMTGTKASMAGSLAWKHSAAAQLFRQQGRAGLKLGHVGKLNIQTDVLRPCMLVGTRMRTYDYDVQLHEEGEEIQQSQHDD